VGPDFAAGDDFLSLHAGATAVARWIESRAAFVLSNERRILAADVETRVRCAEAMVEWLCSWEGPGRDQIEPALLMTDFWRQHGADPDLVALDTRRRSMFDEPWPRDSDAVQKRREEVHRRDEDYMERLNALHGGFRPAVSLGGLPSLRRRGAALRQAKKIGALLARYRTIDMELQVFEDALAEVASGWDRYVQSEIDRARGKTPSISWVGDDGQEHRFSSSDGYMRRAGRAPRRDRLRRAEIVVPHRCRLSSLRGVEWRMKQSLYLNDPALDARCSSDRYSRSTKLCRGPFGERTDPLKDRRVCHHVVISQLPPCVGECESPELSLAGTKFLSPGHNGLEPGLVGMTSTKL
jgi:hypothetical protein